MNRRAGQGRPIIRCTIAAMFGPSFYFWSYFRMSALRYGGCLLHWANVTAETSLSLIHILAYIFVIQLVYTVPSQIGFHHHQPWLYNSWRVLACSKSRFHSSLLYVLAFQFLMFSFPRSSSIWSLNHFGVFPFIYYPVVSGKKYVS